MDVEVRIRSLLWGFRPIQIAIPNSDPCFLLVRDLTTVEHAIVDAKVQKFEYRCSKLGLIKKDELQKTTYKEDEALLWPTISDIMNDKDRFFLTSVITEYNRTSLTTSELREI